MLTGIINENKSKQFIKKTTMITENTSSILNVIKRNRPDIFLHTYAFPRQTADRELFIQIKSIKPVSQTFVIELITMLSYSASI